MFRDHQKEKGFRHQMMSGTANGKAVVDHRRQEKMSQAGQVGDSRTWRGRAVPQEQGTRCGGRDATCHARCSSVRTPLRLVRVSRDGHEPSTAAVAVAASAREWWWWWRWWLAPGQATQPGDATMLSNTNTTSELLAGIAPRRAAHRQVGGYYYFAGVGAFVVGPQPVSDFFFAVFARRPAHRHDAGGGGAATCSATMPVADPPPSQREREHAGTRPCG